MERIKTMQQVKDLVSTTFNVDITKNCRELKYTRARAIYFKLCIDYVPAIKLIDIAASVNLSHCTVSVTLQKFDDRLKYDRRFKKDYDAIYRTITVPEETLIENDMLKEQMEEIKKSVGNKYILQIAELFALLNDEDKVNLEYKLNAIYQMNMGLINSIKKQ